MGFVRPDNIGSAIQRQNDDKVKLGLADPNKFVEGPLSINGYTKPQFSLRTNHLYSTDELASNLARMKIYHPQEFDQRMSFVDSEIKRRYVPARTTRNSIGKPRHHAAQDNGKFIRDAYNNAFKSRVYLDAMRNYELRQQQPDRYVPAGFESLQNLDVLVERGRMLQRRNIVGRRREQPQE
jgi:hypothetical protein